MGDNRQFRLARAIVLVENLKARPNRIIANAMSLVRPLELYQSWGRLNRATNCGESLRYGTLQESSFGTPENPVSAQLSSSCDNVIFVCNGEDNCSTDDWFAFFWKLMHHRPDHCRLRLVTEACFLIVGMTYSSHNHAPIGQHYGQHWILPPKQ